MGGASGGRKMTPRGQMSSSGSGPAIMMMPPHIRATFMPDPPLKHLPPPSRRRPKLYSIDYSNNNSSSNITTTSIIDDTTTTTNYATDGTKIKKEGERSSSKTVALVEVKIEKMTLVESANNNNEQTATSNADINTLLSSSSIKRGRDQGLTGIASYISHFSRVKLLSKSKSNAVDNNKDDKASADNDDNTNTNNDTDDDKMAVITPPHSPSSSKSNNAIITYPTRRQRTIQIRNAEHVTSLQPIIETYREEQRELSGEFRGMNSYRTLFVGRLAYEVTEGRLLREMEPFGPVKNLTIVKNSTNNINDVDGGGSKQQADGVKDVGGDNNGEGAGGKTDGKCDEIMRSKGYAFVEYENEEDMKRAYRGADGVRLEGRAIVVDVERGHTVPNWLPKRLGGGLGGTRLGGKDKCFTAPGRFDPARPPGHGGHNDPMQNSGGHFESICCQSKSCLECCAIS